jgi:NAD(P)-dependent dehydrogenase (short-subunit alcohol dehydrogenase family)
MSLFSRYPAIDLAGAVVLVTGGGRGIGRSTAELFARRGARVVIGDVDESAAIEAAREIGACGLRLDVSKEASFAAFVDAALREHRRVDVLVNNAGVMPLGAFLEEPPRISRWTLDVNLWGLVHGMRLVLPGMIARGRGHVVNVASMAGKLPVPGMAMYNASKFAAVGLTAAVRREIARTGVSVSAVLPSAVRTGLASGVPLGKGMPTVDPEDLAEAVLASCTSRKAEIPVPGYLGAWDLIQALLPEPVMALARDLLRDRRALTSIDREARREYRERVERHAHAQT